MPISSKQFAKQLITWQKIHGRHHLPWQVSDAYAVWVSEIMLQQTQVSTVLNYYPRFMARFPTVTALASADIDDVLSLWSGLGYYSRARNLHRAAQYIATHYGGQFPQQAALLAELPGIGRSTAAAIAAFAFGQREAILDGNVRRVFTRVFAIEGWPGNKAIEQQLWQLAESLLPDAAEIQPYTQGLMDLGSLVCRRGQPDCGSCPFAQDCLANQQGRQRQLPTPRPKREIPQREVKWLLLYDTEGRVFLEKRPPTGIWGGLWSLPEWTAEHTSLAQRLQELAVIAEDTAEAPAPLHAVTHQFTHFHLTAYPYPLAVRTRAECRESASCWVNAAELAHIGLAAPVRRLLETWMSSLF